MPNYGCSYLIHSPCRSLRSCTVIRCTSLARSRSAFRPCPWDTCKVKDDEHYCIRMCANILNGTFNIHAEEVLEKVDALSAVLARIAVAVTQVLLASGASPTRGARTDKGSHLKTQRGSSSDYSYSRSINDSSALPLPPPISTLSYCATTYPHPYEPHLCTILRSNTGWTRSR